MSHSVILSIKVAMLSTILVTIFGLLISYFLASFKFRGKGILEVFLTLPIVMPPTVTGYYLVFIFGRNGIIGNIIYEWTGWTIMFTWYAAILASFIVSLPLMIRTAQAAIESVNKEMIDSAYMLGYSQWQTAIKVIFPLAKKGIIAGIILSFARAIGEFGATLMIAGNIPGKTDTMPLAIYGLTSSGDWEKVHVMVIILTFISGTVLYIANKFSKRSF